MSEGLLTHDNAQSYRRDRATIVGCSDWFANRRKLRFGAGLCQEFGKLLFPFLRRTGPGVPSTRITPVWSGTSFQYKPIIGKLPLATAIIKDVVPSSDVPSI